MAVEPVPDNARRLRANVRLNRAPIEVVEAAVGRAPGSIRMACEGRTSRVDGGMAETIVVPRLTLDQLGEKFGPPIVVKIDIEGAELDALQGAGNVLAGRPAILVETHSPALTAEVARFLRAHGYSVSGADDLADTFVPAHLLAVAEDAG